MTVIDFNSARRQGDNQTNALTAEAVRTRLNANPVSFLEWLYTGRAHIGKKEARIGNVYGKPGASLKVDLTGPATGLWHDKATGEGGDLIGLYRAFMGYKANADFALSLKEIAKDFLNEPIELERPTWHPGPKQQIEKRKAELGTKPRADMLELGAPVAEFRYFDLRNNIIASVVRYEPDGTRENKTFRPYCYRLIDGNPKWGQGAPDIRPLYRLPDIATQPTVVLCEGEGCADALVSLGIAATTAMQGANAPIEKTDWTPLQSKTVIIWPDKDEPGFKYASAVAQKLTSLGCRVMLVAPPNDKPAKWDAADCVAEGGDPGVLIGQATPFNASTIKPRVRLLKLSQLATLEPPQWLIEGVLTRHGLSMLWGRSGSLKSFVALDMAMCIATGHDWHGHKVQKGRVVYLAAEGAHGAGGRVLGWWQNRGRDYPEPEFEFIPHGMTLTNQGDLEALAEAVMDDGPLAFLVIDTVSRSFGSGNPNQPADMNAYVTASDYLKERTQAHVMHVHHAGKDNDKNEVGNEGLRNAADTVIHVYRAPKADTIKLINEAPKGKQKDFDEFKTITLKPVKIAYQHGTTEKTTLILNLAEAEEEVLEHTKLGKVEQAVTNAMMKTGGRVGFRRLKIMTKANDGSISRAIQNLIDKGLIRESEAPEGANRTWELVS